MTPPRRRISIETYDPTYRALGTAVNSHSWTTQGAVLLANLNLALFFIVAIALTQIEE